MVFKTFSQILTLTIVTRPQVASQADVHISEEEMKHGEVVIFPSFTELEMTGDL